MYSRIWSLGSLRPLRSFMTAGPDWLPAFEADGSEPILRTDGQTSRLDRRRDLAGRARSSRRERCPFNIKVSATPLMKRRRRYLRKVTVPSPTWTMVLTMARLCWCVTRLDSAVAGVVTWVFWGRSAFFHRWRACSRPDDQEDTHLHDGLALFRTETLYGTASTDADSTDLDRCS